MTRFSYSCKRRRVFITDRGIIVDLVHPTNWTRTDPEDERLRLIVYVFPKFNQKVLQT